jgi:hypothetical protein
MTDEATKYTTVPATAELRRRIKTLAAQSDMSMIDLLTRMVDLYERDRQYDADARKTRRRNEPG